MQTVRENIARTPGLNKQYNKRSELVWTQPRARVVHSCLRSLGLFTCTFYFRSSKSCYENTGCIPCVLTEIRKQTVPYVSKHHRFSRLRLESAGNGILVTACNTETRPPPAGIAINGHGRSRTGAAVWIAVVIRHSGFWSAFFGCA